MRKREGNWMEPRRGLIGRLSTFATRHPWLVIGGWSVALVLLTYSGRDAKSVLKNEELFIEGTKSYSAIEKEYEKFGRSDTLAILLKGSREGINRYGPRLAGKLDTIRDVSVVSPWSGQMQGGLRRGPEKALMLLHVKRPTMWDVAQDVAPKVRAHIDETLPGSMTSHMTGVPVVGQQIDIELYDGTRKAEIIALPFLVIILLLIFRSPLAAALPFVMGISVIVATNGIITIIAKQMPVDALAQTTGTMVGLALGVDYSLLIVSRFREELERGSAVPQALQVAMATAGRTVVFAGSIVVMGVLILIAAVPNTQSLTTGTFGIVSSTVLSVVAAVTLLPACLRLIGVRVNLWRIGRRSAKPKLVPLVSRLIRRPLVASLIVLLPILALSVPAFGLDTGLVDVDFLQEDNPVRKDVEAIMKETGGDWGAPFTVIATSKKGPVTGPRQMREIARFQRSLLKDGYVQSIFGPQAIAGDSRKLSLSFIKGGRRMDELNSGLGQSYRGLAGLRRGLKRASVESSQIAGTASGNYFSSQRLMASINQAASSLDVLERQVRASAASAASLSGEVGQVASAASSLRSASYEASVGASSLQGPAAAFREDLAQSQGQLDKLGQAPADAQSALDRAKAALDGAALPTKADPSFQAAYQAVLTAQGNISGYNPLDSTQQVQSGYYGMEAAIDRATASTELAAGQAADLASGVEDLAQGTDELTEGAAELEDAAGRTSAGAASLDEGASKVSGGSAKLKQGMGSLSQGTGSLTEGLSRLYSGAGDLESGLNSGYKQSGKLASGIGKMRKSTSRSANGLSAGGREKVAESGYLTLAALDGAPARQRESVEQIVNAKHGGDTTRMVVIVNGNPVLKEGVAFRQDLLRRANELGKRIGADVEVGGRASIFQDFDRVTAERRVPVIIMLSVASLLFLIVVFRSLLLAAKAVVLNLLTVGAAFGAVAIFFGGPDPILGGSGWMEAITFFLVYVVVFTLSMDYEIFIINRMREGYARGGDNELAIEEGIAKTAGVITGAATVMIVLFGVMATFGLAAMRQFGIAMTVAVLVDATVIRLILLPATMRLFGRANWWLPKWLDRRLPKLGLES